MAEAERAGRWGARAGWIALVALVVPALLAPVHFVEDDAFFYLEIGRRIAAGEGSTFQGLFPTNGYHPLWLGVVALLGTLLGGAREPMLLASVAVSAALFAGAVVGLHRVLGRAGVATAALGTTLVAATFLGETWYVSEMALNAALQVAALALVVEGRSTRRLGLVLGLATLARLDDVFLVGAITALVAWRRGPRPALVVGGLAALVVAPYVAWNLATFGHPVPISGTLKSALPHLDLVDVGGKLGAYGKLGVVAGLAALIGLAAGALRGPLGEASAAWGAAALVHAAYVALGTRHGWTTWWGWYYVTGLLAAGLTLPQLLDRLAARALPSFRPATVGALLAACVGAPVVARTWATAFVVPGWSGMRVPARVQGPPWGLAAPRPEIRFAAALDARLPPDARLVVHDLPGVTAWYGRRPVVALDALTADWTYLDDLDRRGLLGEAHALGITHLLVPDGSITLPWLDVRATETEVVLDARAPRGGAPVGTVTLDRTAPLLRSADVLGDRPWALVYRIEDARPVAP